MEDFWLHDFRHNFASMAVNNGVSLEVLGKFLGHKNFSTAQRYAHITSVSAVEAANEISNKFSLFLGD